MAGDREDSRLQKERLGQEAKATNFDWVTVISPEDLVVPPTPFVLTLAPVSTVVPTCLDTQQEEGNQEQPRILSTGWVSLAGEGCPGHYEAGLHLERPA